MAMMTIAEALREGIREEMQRDPRVFCLGEDIGITGGFGGAFTVTLGLSDQFGHERILDTPISEIGIAGVAIGAAMAGLRPIADVQYGDFLFCMMDQLANQAAKMTYMSGGTVSVPMVMRAPVGSTRRGTQHAQSLEGSKGARSEKGALSPVGEVPDGDYIVPIGKGIIRREGSDVTIVGKLTTVYMAMAAAELLAKEGINAEVIDPRTLVPLDKDLIRQSVRKTGRLVIAEEDNQTGGWAGDIAAMIAEEEFYYLDAPIKRVSAPDTPPPFAPIMEAFYLPSADKIIQAVKSIM